MSQRGKTLILAALLSLSFILPVQATVHCDPEINPAMCNIKNCTTSSDCPTSACGSEPGCEQGKCVAGGTGGCYAQPAGFEQNYLIIGVACIVCLAAVGFLACRYWKKRAKR